MKKKLSLLELYVEQITQNWPDLYTRDERSDWTSFGKEMIVSSDNSHVHKRVMSRLAIRVLAYTNGLHRRVGVF
jgi:hypothetical protein